MPHCSIHSKRLKISFQYLVNINLFVIIVGYNMFSNWVNLPYKIFVITKGKRDLQEFKLSVLKCSYSIISYKVHMYKSSNSNFLKTFRDKLNHLYKHINPLWANVSTPASKGSVERTPVVAAYAAIFLYLPYCIFTTDFH